jgi:hypothetical protein
LIFLLVHNCLVLKLLAMAISGESKPADSVEEYDIGSNVADGMHTSALGGTSHDAQDMRRMGKKQELRVFPS